MELIGIKHDWRMTPRCFQFPNTVHARRCGRLWAVVESRERKWWTVLLQWAIVVVVVFSPVNQLRCQVANIIKAIHRLLREKSIKTRQCCFSLLSELVQVLHGALTEHISLVIPGVHFSLGQVHVLLQTMCNSEMNLIVNVTCELYRHDSVPCFEKYMLVRRWCRAETRIPVQTWRLTHCRSSTCCWRLTARRCFTHTLIHLLRLVANGLDVCVHC